MDIHGRDGGIARKQKNRKRNMQLDHSVTHVKRKQGEMGTTETASDAHSSKKAKPNV